MRMPQATAALRAGVVLCVFASMGCHTATGIGEDMQGLGEAAQQAARDRNPYGPDRTPNPYDNR